MENNYLKTCAQAIINKYPSGAIAAEACQISDYTIRQVISGQSVSRESQRRIRLCGDRILAGLNPNPTWTRGDSAMLSSARDLANKSRARGHVKEYRQDSVHFSGDRVTDPVPEDYETVTQDDIYDLKKIGGRYMIRIAKLEDRDVYCPAIVRPDPDATNLQFVIQ